MKYTNHQYMTKVFHFLQKKLGITAGYSTLSMEALKTNVLTCRMFMSSSMKAAIHLGPNELANLEGYKNTNFEEIQSLFNIAQKLILEYSEEILNVRAIESPSLSWTRSVLSHDHVIQWTKAKLRVYSDSVLCLGKMYENKDASERCEGPVEEFKLSPSHKECWESMENQLNSSGIFSKDFRHCRFFRKSRMICESGSWNLRDSQTGSSSCQCSTTSIGQGICTSNSEKSRNTRKDSCRDTGRFSVLETKNSGMELFLIHLRENMTLQPLKWWNDSKIPVISIHEYQCFESRIPEQEK